jgi:MFS superfamily sulfate permease-like transporter
MVRQRQRRLNRNAKLLKGESMAIEVNRSSTRGRDSFVKDLSASLVVFLVALPLCMGIALASGMPAAAGLVTGVIGGLVVGTLAGSPLQVSGPAAGLAVIVFEMVQQHGLAALGPILMLAGAMQLAAGLLKTGRWFRAISPEVIHGMLAGIGVLIVIQQFHVVLDRSPEHSGLANIKAMWGAVFGGLFPLNGSNEEAAAMIGVVTLAVMLLWEKFRPAKLKLVPGALLGIGCDGGGAELSHDGQSCEGPRGPGRHDYVSKSNGASWPDGCRNCRDGLRDRFYCQCRDAAFCCGSRLDADAHEDRL